MATATLLKANIELGLAYRFRSLVHYCHGRKHGDMQADIKPEKELRVLHQNWKAEGSQTLGLA